MFKVNDEWELLSIKIFLVKVILKIGQEKYLLSNLISNLTLGHKIKDLNVEKIIGSFYEKNCCKVYDKWVIIQNQRVISEITEK